MDKKRAIIEFKGISKSFGKKKVLEDISLNISQGEIFAIIGRSGSGKSTLMKVLLGVHKPSSGKVLYEGRDITGNLARMKKIVGLTTQDNSFYDKLTVHENMVYYANLYCGKLSRKELESRISSILSSVELDRDASTLAGNLSGGMKRRLDFALSMIHDPQILLLDEPTTGLDPILVKQFWSIVKGVAKKGKTILVITHIFPEIMEYCDSACILHKGHIQKVFDIKPGVNLFAEFSNHTIDNTSSKVPGGSNR